MKIDNEFTVSVPVQQAWDVMLDLQKIAPCLPGAAIQDEKGDGEYAGTMKVKIGPITANYKGTVKIEEADQENRRAVLQATGRDARGQGTASATIVSTLQEEGAESTKVNVETDMHLTGRAAQFGRGIAQDVATKMLTQFAECLEREISGGSTQNGATENGSAESAAPTETSGDSGDGAAAQEAPTATAGGGAGGTAGRVISSEDPTVKAGGPVEGAVVSDGGTSEAAGAAQPAAGEAPRRESEEPEAFDLGAASQEAILKRVGPVLVGLGLLVFLIWLIRRRH
jgi:carbon monoxide dehydrogenase subunit G